MSALLFGKKSSEVDPGEQGIVALKTTFLLGGNGWEGLVDLPNLRYLGHVVPGDHNAVNCSARAVLNVTRDSMVGVALPGSPLPSSAGART